MQEKSGSDAARSRTQFIDTPENRDGDDRRKDHCYLANDRRSGLACRRREKQRELERKIAASRVIFYPSYYRIP